MKRLVSILVLAAALAGCSANEQFVKATDDLATPICDDYIRIVTDPDVQSVLRQKFGWDDDTVRIRVGAAEQLKRLIRDAKEQ